MYVRYYAVGEKTAYVTHSLFAYAFLRHSCRTNRGLRWFRGPILSLLASQWHFRDITKRSYIKVENGSFILSCLRVPAVFNLSLEKSFRLTTVKLPGVLAHTVHCVVRSWCIQFTNSLREIKTLAVTEDISNNDSGNWNPTWLCLHKISRRITGVLIPKHTEIILWFCLSRVSWQNYVFFHAGVLRCLEFRLEL